MDGNFQKNLRFRSFVHRMIQRMIHLTEEHGPTFFC